MRMHLPQCVANRVCGYGGRGNRGRGSEVVSEVVSSRTLSLGFQAAGEVYFPGDEVYFPGDEVLVKGSGCCRTQF